MDRDGKCLSFSDDNCLASHSSILNSCFYFLCVPDLAKNSLINQTICQKPVFFNDFLSIVSTIYFICFLNFLGIEF